MDVIRLVKKLNSLDIKIRIADGELKVRTKENLSSEIIDEIRFNKQELLSFYNKQEFVTIPKAKKQDHYALSSAQKRLYLLQQMDLESTAYNIPYTIPIVTGVDKSKIERVFQQLISRHESFRTSFEIEGEEPVQRIHEQVEFKIDKYRVEKSEIQELRNGLIQAFDLSQAPLLRVAIAEINGEGSLLMIDMHHIISDGVSHAVLEKDFAHLYSGDNLVPLRLQYKDYSEWQNSEIQQSRIKNQEDYWLTQLEGELPVLNLPLDYVRPVMQSHEGAIVTFTLSRDETESLKSLTKENGLTLYMSVLSVFSILLSKLSGQEDIIIGSPIAGRNHSDLGHIVGVFVNTLAIRNEVDGNNTIKEFIAKLKQNTLDAYENQDYQFEDLVEQLSVERDTSRNPVFDVMFNMLNQEDYKGDLSTFNNNDLIHRSGVSKFDLTLTAFDYGEQLLLSFEYCTKLFKSETIDRFINYLKQIVYQLPNKFDEKLSRLEIISAEERQQLLYDFNNTNADYPKHKTIHQLFEEQVAQRLENIALKLESGAITYKELNGRANCIAKTLREKGIGSDDIVAVFLDRSFETIYSILGILKAGGAYLPIDPDYPDDRIDYIINDSDVETVITIKDFSTRIKNEGDIIYVEELSSSLNSFQNIESVSKASDLSYIIYTSGTTGKPKGIMVEHRNVVSYLYAFQKEFQLNSDDVVMQQASVSFDTFVEEVYPILNQGGSLEIIEKDKILDLEKLGRLILKNNITVISCSPLLLNEINALSLELLRNIRVFISGGDVLRYSYINNLINISKVYNTYGPTETTVCSLFHEYKKGNIENIPIGRPVANDSVYLLDKNNELLPIGVQGELCIGGAGLSRGYVNNKELTANKFIDHPYKEGKKLYRTGDLARWLPDGNIEFLGRVDNQVKIRGFRIELGEIEKVLLLHKNVKECVVIAREESLDKYLCAYLVFKTEQNIEELRSYLSILLPHFMLPSYFVGLKELPLTSNGKINRKELPFPEVKVRNNYVAPRNNMEETLVDIWSEVLRIEKEKIGIDANFFELGGHSLFLIKVVQKIANSTEYKLNIMDLFRNTTIRKLTSYIEGVNNVDVCKNDRTKEIDNGKNSMKALLNIRRS